MPRTRSGRSARREVGQFGCAAASPGLSQAGRRSDFVTTDRERSRPVVTFGEPGRANPREIFGTIVGVSSAKERDVLKIDIETQGSEAARVRLTGEAVE